MIIAACILGYIFMGLLVSRQVYIFGTRHGWVIPDMPAALCGLVWPIGIPVYVLMGVWDRLSLRKAWDWWFQDPKERKALKEQKAEALR